MAHPILERLKNAIFARGFTIAAVSRRLEPAVTPATLSRALLGQHRLHPDYYDQILDIIGEPRELFWKRHYEAESGQAHPGLGDLEPSHLLRLIAGQPATEAPETVEKLLKAGLPELGEDPLRSLPAQLRELDELRLVDLEASYRECLAWIEACGEKLFAQDLDSQTLAELLTALGAFSSVLRSRGQSRLAASVLSAAFETINSARSGLVVAWLQWRSAPILTDAGYPKIAIAHLHQSRSIFDSFGQHLDWIGASISLGGHSIYLGDFEQARRCLERALLHPEVSQKYQVAALSNLAKVFELTGQPEAALELIESLEASGHLSEPGRMATCGRWIEASALAAAGNLEIAAEHFAGLRGDVARYCTPADSLLVFLDYAAVLHRIGDDRRLRAAAEVAIGALSQLDSDSKIYKQASRALVRIAEHSATAAELKRIRSQLTDLS